jgi:hypothetical protein
LASTDTAWVLIIEDLRAQAELSAVLMVAGLKLLLLL